MTQEEKELYNAANAYAFDLDCGDLNTNRDTFVAGAKWQKEQMMKDAVEWMKNYVLNHDYIDIFEMESSFKIYMEGSEQ